MGTKDWVSAFELREQLHQAWREGHGRMTDVPAFQVDIADEHLGEFAGDGDGPKPDLDLENFLDSEMLDEVRRVLPKGAALRVCDADVGRGAGGFGLVLEIMGYVADVGGVATMSYVVAKATRNAYEKLTTRLGTRPLVSRGAATHLAAADLCTRLGVESVVVVGAHDLADVPPDFSYTGEDSFFVVLRGPDYEETQKTYLYVVTARGRCHATGDVNVADDP